jgi:asparagine synthase (glutamine-hydrolysing)
MVRLSAIGKTMCGILAWVVSSAKRQGHELLVNATDLMSHRGPDGAGYWLSDTRDRDHQIALGHRRLSIVDFESGAQPMWSADKSTVVIFNGEIYNYLELRGELLSLGHHFQTLSDTEVIIEGYKAWGLSAITRFRGMFALALWDQEKQQLLIARDPFGKKPLFIGEVAGGYVVGSEINSLLQFPGISRDLDQSSLEDYLLNRYVPGPFTFFRSVKKLPPGTYGIWKKGRLSITRYHEPPFAKFVGEITTFREAVEAFAEKFDEAVSIRMQGDTASGAYLSGGIDSSAIVATMVRHSSTPVKTFSVGFSDNRYSELHYARDIARLFGSDHHEVIIDPQVFLRDWPIAVLRRGAPISEPADIPIFILSKIAARSVKKVLTGEGSDELLGGYPKHRAEKWIGRYQEIIPQFVHDNVILPAAESLPYGMQRLKTLAMAAGQRNLNDRLRAWFGGVSVQDRNYILGRSAVGAPRDLFPFSACNGSSVRRAMYFDQTSWLPDNLLERCDRMMMAGSVEGRMPFMDVELNALTARFPDRFLIGGRGGKAVLRAAMKGILPKCVLQRKKNGFRVPVGDWFGGPYRELVRDSLLSKTSIVRDICNQKAVDGIVNQHFEGKANNEKTLWSLVNLELFLRTFTPTRISKEA